MYMYLRKGSTDVFDGGLSTEYLNCVKAADGTTLQDVELA